MDEPKLFLGVQISGDLAALFLRLSGEKKALFLGPDAKNLQKIVCEGVEYLGKYTGTSLDLETLFLLETNVMSLLGQIFPDFEFKRSSLLLVPHLEQSARVPV